MDSKQVIEAVENGELAVFEDNPHYRIYECVVKHYPRWKLLVQSSGEPIALGASMLPLMDSSKLRAFADEHGIRYRENTPLELYLYNWVDRAQGPMIFDVGFVVPEDFEPIANEHGFVVKEVPAQKVASIAYQGPFPYEPMSGWGNIHWEQRARERGLVYTEKLYRELYHAYDFEKHRHIVEIQIEIE